VGRSATDVGNLLEAEVRVERWMKEVGAGRKNGSLNALPARKT